MAEPARRRLVLASASPFRRRMLEAVANLPEEEREAFDLVRIQGLSQAEAAQVLGVSAMTVNRRLNRGLRLLAEVLRHSGPGSPGASHTMRPFSDAFLADYLRVAGDRVCHTVGAYEIEGLGIQLFERIEGSLFTIIGLPLLPLLAELRARGVIDA